MTVGDLPDSDRDYTKVAWANHYGPIEDAGYSMRQAIEFNGRLAALESDELAGVEIASMISVYPVTAWGVSMREGGQPKPIAPSSVGQIPLADLDADSLLPENSGPHDGWRHVRIIPALDAPDTARLICDTEMRLAFEYLVGSDLIVMAERMAIGGNVASRPAYGCDLFKSVRLGSTAAALGREIHNAFLTRAAQDLPIEKLKAHRHLFHRMADRAIRLLDKLRRGEIIAWGKPDKTADRARIDTDVWQLPDMLCDFTRGHLIDDKGDDGWKFIRLSPIWWSPAGQSQADQVVRTESLPIWQQKSPAEESKKAIKEVYRDLFPRGCGKAIKSRNQDIREYIINTGMLPPGAPLSDSTIDRALKDVAPPRIKPRKTNKKP